MLRYNNFDPAHNIDHVESVLSQSITIALNNNLDVEMSMVVAVYHDLGLDPNLDDFIAINLLIKALAY